ncbi:hypothetical protein [Klenkia sp. PcliD-1-E]|uniref:hypothetical protein n=1 Tax=Klenkia sp. PcliD-1-E TaxID=2954492 RepID=UPI002098213B|nr:hypothetical protein [Klenkia sp. PcliD-1-E]MCO7221173.1 hypothetical protein [Klenkia sp. PcliD-1-E]
MGGWEHECCGPAIERGRSIALGCVRRDDATGSRLVETHHGDDVDLLVEGRVIDIVAVRPDGAVEAIRRLPGGEALRGLHESDDGRLEHLRTGRRVRYSGEEFRVTVRSR